MQQSLSVLSALSTFIALAAALLLTPAAWAGPVVGLDPSGAGHYSSYADLWTSVSDTALAGAFIPGIVVGEGGAAPYLTSLRSQMVVGAMSKGGPSGDVTPPGLNSAFELSAVLRLEELVDWQTPWSAHFALPASQSAAMDVDPLHAGVQNIAVYLDRLGPDGASRAVSGAGFGTVRCYGAGPTSAGCGGPGDPDGDGLLIMSGHLIFNEGLFSVAADGGHGVFQMRFAIDYVDAGYLDLATGAVFEEVMSGLASIPADHPPATMWDGTAADGVLLRFDGARSFAALAVPEPPTPALFGLGLGLAALTLAQARRHGRV